MIAAYMYSRWQKRVLYQQLSDKFHHRLHRCDMQVKSDGSAYTIEIYMIQHKIKHLLSQFVSQYIKSLKRIF